MVSLTRGGLTNPPASAPPAVAFAALDRQGAVRLRLSVDGRECEVAVEPWTTLLDALRERLGLRGTKTGCNPRASPYRPLHSAPF